jgi:tetratricopeptide (TPR) repeat protein
LGEDLAPAVFFGARSASLLSASGPKNLFSSLRDEDSVTSALKSKRTLHLFCFLIFCAELSLSQTATKASAIRDHLARAQAALQSRHPEIAASELRAVLTLDPKNAEAHANLGAIEFAEGNCADATRDFQAALAVRPSLSKAQALLGICDKRAGKDSSQSELEKSFADLKDPRVRTQVGLELMSLYDTRGDTDRSIPVMRALVAMNSDDPNVLYFAQRLYSELADDTLNKLAIVAPDSARMQQVIAEHLVNAGDLTNAIAHYQRALEIDPHLAGLHFELAEAVLESAASNPQSQADAERELEAGVNTDGDNAKAECLFGRIALLQNNTDAAFAHFRKALDLNANEVEAQMGMARVLTIKEKPEEAMKYLTQAISADPLNAAAHYRLAVAYRSLHKTAEAEKEMKLFQEIKQTNDQVRDFYHQMNKSSRVPTDDLPEQSQ